MIDIEKYKLLKGKLFKLSEEVEAKFKEFIPLEKEFNGVIIPLSEDYPNFYDYLDTDEDGWTVSNLQYYFDELESGFKKLFEEGALKDE